MSFWSRLGFLQLPVAAFGLLGVATAANQLSTLPPSPPGSDGFVGGLAVFFLYALGFTGFVIAALGFAIPPGDHVGIRFTRWQRRLFVGAAVCAFGSVIAPLVAWPLIGSTRFGPDVALGVRIGLSVAAILALVGGLGWRTIQTLSRRLPN